MNECEHMRVKSLMYRSLLLHVWGGMTCLCVSIEEYKKSMQMCAANT